MSLLSYTDLVPDERRLIRAQLTRRERVALQRTCRTARDDDPGPFTTLSMPPPTASYRFRAFALCALADVIDADIDLRQPSLCTAAFHEEGKHAREFLNHAVEFHWRLGAFEWHGNSYSDTLVAHFAPGPYIPMSGVPYHLPTLAPDGTVPQLIDSHPAWWTNAHLTDAEIRRPVDALVLWTVRRQSPVVATTHGLFHCHAWSLAKLEEGAQWIGLPDFKPPRPAAQ